MNKKIMYVLTEPALRLRRYKYIYIYIHIYIIPDHDNSYENNKARKSLKSDLKWVAAVLTFLRGGKFEQNPEQSEGLIRSPASEDYQHL